MQPLLVGLGSGELAPAAAELVAEFATYTEISPSGRGLKLFIRGTKPAGAGSRRKGVVPGVKEVEVYDSKRFFTITRRQWPGMPLAVEARQPQLDALCARLWTPRPTNPNAAARTAQGASGGAEARRSRNA